MGIWHLTKKFNLHNTHQKVIAIFYSFTLRSKITDNNWSEISLGISGGRLNICWRFNFGGLHHKQCFKCSSYVTYQGQWCVSVPLHWARRRLKHAHQQLNEKYVLDFWQQRRGNTIAEQMRLLQKHSTFLDTIELNRKWFQALQWKQKKL